MSRKAKKSTKFIRGKKVIVYRDGKAVTTPGNVSGYSCKIAASGLSRARRKELEEIMVYLANTNNSKENYKLITHESSYKNSSEEDHVSQRKNEIPGIRLKQYATSK